MRKILLTAIFLPIAFSSYCLADDLYVADLNRITSGHNFQDMTQWEINEVNIICIALNKERKFVGSKVQEDEIKFYKIIDDKLISIGKYSDRDYFMDLESVQLIRDGNMMTLWQDSEGVTVRIFTYTEDGALKLVLDERSHRVPIIGYMASDGIIIAKGEHGCWVAFEYKWDGEEYKLISTEPWDDRLN
jgi:hypothetical protein